MRIRRRAKRGRAEAPAWQGSRAAARAILGDCAVTRTQQANTGCRPLEAVDPADSERIEVPTIAQIEEQILVVEGFRVRLTPLLVKTKSFPSYDFTVMAPQRWRLSDWRSARLKLYLTMIRGVVVLRGDGSPIKSDLQLGNVRDGYYARQYGTTAQPARDADF